MYLCISVFCRYRLNIAPAAKLLSLLLCFARLPGRDRCLAIMSCNFLYVNSSSVSLSICVFKTVSLLLLLLLSFKEIRSTFLPISDPNLLKKTPTCSILHDNSTKNKGAPPKPLFPNLCKNETRKLSYRPDSLFMPLS